MTERIKAWFEALGNQFWLRPALVIVFCILLSQGAVELDRLGVTTGSDAVSGWLYGGGGSGARSLLSAVASSVIGVAGTIFSITVAALSLASGQMGPRLLRNFVRDAGNQIALGIFLGTFAYALMVLRTVRSADEGEFVPHFGVTGSIVLAMLCIATLVWFVHHIATGINVEKVVTTVHRDLCRSIERLTDPLSTPDGAVGDTMRADGEAVATQESGYVQAIDLKGLGDFARKHDIHIRMLVGPGVFVSPGMSVALVSGRLDEARKAVRDALVIGRELSSVQDLEFSARQLVEMAVRALSPGINDPFTAAAVLDHLGDALCRVAARRLRRGEAIRDGRVVATAPATDYDGLTDTMFHTIRQNGSGSAFVLIRLMEVLGRVAQVEPDPARRRDLSRHADLTLAAGKDGLSDRSALADLESRFRRFGELLAASPVPGDIELNRRTARQHETSGG